MKRVGIVFALLACSAASAQWEYVGDGLGSQAVRSMFCYADTLTVGTADGLYRSETLGESWADVSGSIGSRAIVDVRGGAGPRVVWAATEAGVWFTADLETWADGTADLPDVHATYFWFGDTGEGAVDRDWAVGTASGGLFAGPELDGPWTACSGGLAGDALSIRDLSGYSDNELDYTTLATADGVWFSTDHMGSWSENGSGLTGASRSARRLAAVGGLTIAATDGGLHYTTDQGANWAPIFDGPRFRTVGISLQPFLLGAFGEEGHVTFDFVNWTELDMGDVEGGDVTCMAVGLTHLYVGTETGGVYRMALDQVDVEQAPSRRPSGFALDAPAPNPFNPTTELAFELDRPAQARLSVHDLLGREVAVLVDGPLPAGRHRRTFDAADLASGVYVCTLRTPGGVESRRMLLMK